MTQRIEAAWLADPRLRSILKALGTDGEEARVVGGAVRNHLLGRPITDVDIATTAEPQAVIARAQAAGFKAVPTGIAHGTVTVVADERPFEVTTLRRDHETDGRHAKVIFGRDWKADAERRDFTVNALYCDAEGEILDLVGGLADIETRTLRFIGDAAARIEEDYLRILRFYRFFAWYGDGRPDAEGLRATVRLKDGLSRLSAERVWAELRKLLAAPDPSRALLWMRQSGVLTQVLPESEKWGIDAIHPLARAEAELGWPADPLLRLMAIVPPDGARMGALAKRLRFSNVDRDRLTAWALSEAPNAETTDAALRRLLYYGDRQALIDRLRLALAAERGRGTVEGSAASARLFTLLAHAERFEKPELPVSGEDLVRAGLQPGPDFGAALRRLETAYVDSGFALDRDALLEKL
ncbi:CCA tRNA nucleotidyltransferase [Aureimonas mangrovi]|uniref:CCA tRNA nucleotidyltransferase n=1 Tax=Aureimonas mangrovi TaxID=2758041 RepID=UPI00163D4F22|nr:CCA tRNA nucleotidyltransferase [Aureimonas mangrovi]